MIRGRTKRGIAVLTLVAVLSWLGARDGSPPAAKPFANLDTRLNYALFDFKAKLLNDEGKLNLHIEAPILRNNANSQVGTMESPNIIILQQDKEWYINADSAIITADREHVSLMGKVDMKREGQNPNDNLEIQTRDVMFNVEPQILTTDAAVTMVQNGDLLNADGMRLNMKTDSYELLNKVRAQYATP
jgi:LPS export ABC transporter protein LptC